MDANTFHNRVVFLTKMLCAGTAGIVTSVTGLSVALAIYASGLGSFTRLDIGIAMGILAISVVVFVVAYILRVRIDKQRLRYMELHDERKPSNSLPS